MSELEELAAGVAHNVAEAVDGKVEGWAGKLLDEADRAAQRRLDGMERGMAHTVISAMRPSVPAIGRLGADRLRDVLGLLYDGQSDEARDLWVVREATFEERRAAMREAATASVTERDQREADWEAFSSALVDLGARAIRLAVPFLLAALA